MMRYLMLLLLVAGTHARADMRIFDIEGDSAAVTLLRGGQPAELAPFVSLKIGDEIRVANPGTRVKVGDGREQTTVDKDNSPYRVGDVARPTVLDNMIAAAVKQYRGLVGNDEKVLSVHSRGDPEQAPRLRCFLPGDNPVPVGVGIRLYWTNGSAPFRIFLTAPGSGAAGAYEVQIEAPKSPALLDIPALSKGVYRIRITDSAGAEARDAARLQIVPFEALPQQARDLLQSDLPVRAKSRLIAAVLAELEVWQLASLLYAARAEDTALVSGLLADCPI
jgi:hypothetical protein